MFLEIPRIGMYLVTKMCKRLESETIFDTFSQEGSNDPRGRGQRHQVKLSDLECQIEALSTTSEQEALEFRLGVDIALVKF